jgi:hypothetical protein
MDVNNSHLSTYQANFNNFLGTKNFLIVTQERLGRVWSTAEGRPMKGKKRTRMGRREYVKKISDPPDLPPAVVPSFKLGWGSSQARDPGGA